MKNLIIIPVYNEENNIQDVINDIEKNVKDFDYVIINDCSTDNTKHICEKNKYNVINSIVNLGIGGAVQTGFLYAEKNNYDFAIQFDGDGQHDAKYLNNMLKYIIESNSDMVIGSRFINKNGFQSSFSRRIGIKYFSWLIKLLTKKEITDPTSGFRMVNKKLISMFCKYYPQDYPEPESVVSVLRKKYTIKEIPVEMHSRKSGKSSINILQSFYYMIKVTLAIIIDVFKPEYGI